MYSDTVTGPENYKGEHLLESPHAEEPTYFDLLINGAHPTAATVCRVRTLSLNPPQSPGNAQQPPGQTQLLQHFHTVQIELLSELRALFISDCACVVWCSVV